jgi:ethanolamine kinase
MESALFSCSSPVVFCHNDLIYNNIIMLAGGEEVRFIDYEYGMDNYAAFDIAEHFNEFVGIESDLDYDKYYPDKAFQTQWIENYLRQG